MKLQKNTLLALSSVLEIAGQPQRHLAAGEIADKYQVSSHHLAKVLAELVRAGLVESVRGAGGGYRFIGNASRVTLMVVVELFEDIAPTRRQPPPPDANPVEQALHSVLRETDDNSVATFSSITLATMLRMIARQQGSAQVLKLPERRPAPVLALADLQRLRGTGTHAD